MEINKEAWQKIQEADEMKINHEAIKDFLQDVKKFEEENPEVKIYEIYEHNA